MSLMLVALGELGDTRARRTLFDPDRDLHVTSLQAPEGFDDQLAEALIAHPSLTWEPEGLTTTAGSQTARLSAADHPVIARFEALLRRVLDRFLAARVPDPSHPRDFQVPTDFELNLWGTVLSEGGHQAPHIHPAGWLSGVYYAKVPSTVSGADPTQAGWIEFDRAGYGLPVSASVAPRVVCPQQGALVLFPSALFHRTLPLRGTDLRVSLAFDLHPTGFRR